MTKLTMLIRAMPQGRYQKIADGVGVSRMTVYRLICHGYGSDELAQRVAAFVGKPDQWKDLLAPKPKKPKAIPPKKAGASSRKPAAVGCTKSTPSQKSSTTQSEIVESSAFETAV